MVHDVFIKGKDGVTYINKSILTTKLHYNKVIITILTELVEKYPEWRFQQLLVNVGISTLEDVFYEESVRTLDLMLRNTTVTKYFRLYKPEVKKADVVNFNDFKK